MAGNLGACGLTNLGGVISPTLRITCLKALDTTQDVYVYVRSGHAECMHTIVGDCFCGTCG
jgi:hypothetical protein